MIKFDISKYKHGPSGECFLSSKEIDDITETLLKDYNPSLLSHPQAIDYDDFVGSYLGYDVDYQHIYFGQNEQEILGCALFDTQQLKVFKADHSGIDILDYGDNSIVIDRVLVDETNPSRHIQLISSVLHEAGHLYLQQEWGHINKNQQNLFSQGVKICCRKSDYNIFFKPTANKDEQFREWQANTFAFSVALNKYALKEMLINILRKNGIKQDFLITDHFTESFYRHEVTEQLKQVFGVSKEGIFYRLRALKLYVTQKEFNETHSQMFLF